MTKKLDDIIIEHQFFSSDEAEKNIEGRLLVADRLFQNMLEGVFITNTKGVIQFINPAFSMITGYGEEVIGQNPSIFQSGKHDATFYRSMWESIEQNGKWMGEVWNKKEDGELFLQQTTITKIKDDYDQPLYYAAVITDITERKKAEQRLKDDLLLAKEVQKSALSHPIQTDSFHIDGIYLPSEFLGGDTYAWYQIDSHRYGVIMLDVMGHGVASALVCMSVRSLLRGIINTYVEPGLVLKELNDHVYSLFRDKESLQMKNYYLTCVYAVVDTNKHSIQFASAGHPPAFLISNNGMVRELADGTVPLGMLKNIEVETGNYTYDYRNTWMVFYTDGLIENEDNQIRKNIEGLKNNLLKYRSSSISEMMIHVVDQQLLELNTLAFYDDVTMVVAKL
ncbi:sigma-B regulation protein RsbU (phosphoserine phosphatase) [Ureibacillus xyleni]|uniref:Sigma-B regulation protein RsbU (Phosphoserine phosphatase) n=1 Tax=Ureibacillus xyleni TaxID=614648 RepID=A0A285SYG9_9BACL|nr:SpoIIE family protein phosphatase [Ureibacillus xyleni]SOC13379.1 sigma-B regulation protein RsbU (phosphoserine phosphatase) [Ureibacillus xyleni]